MHYVLRSSVVINKLNFRRFASEFDGLRRAHAFVVQTTHYPSLATLRGVAFRQNMHWSVLIVSTMRGHAIVVFGSVMVSNFVYFVVVGFARRVMKDPPFFVVSISTIGMDQFEPRVASRSINYSIQLQYL